MERLRNLSAIALFLLASTILPPQQSLAGGNRLMLDFPMAYTLPAGLFEATIFHNRADSRTDIFNLIADPNDQFFSYGAIFNLGILDPLTFSIKVEFAKFDISPRLPDGARVDKLKIGLKYNILKEGQATPALSLGLSYTENETDRARVLLPPPFRGFSIRGFRDEAFGTSLLLSKMLTDRLALHGQLAWDSVETLGDTERIISLGAGADFDILRKFKVAAYFRHLDVDRNTGVDLDIFGPAVRFARIFVSNKTDNDVLDVKLTYFLRPRLAVTLQGTIFGNGLPGEIPHLSILAEQLSPGRFTRFGYLGLGFTLRYDLFANF